MKEIIAQNFSKGARNYDRFAIIQKRSARNLLNLISNISYTKAIDIGAGSGELASKLKNCIGVDISPQMCKCMEEKGIKCVCADAEKLPFPDETFDLAVSNFAFQWMNIKKAMKESHRILKQNGSFALSIPIEGSLSELFSAWQKVSISLNGKEDKLFRFPSYNTVILYAKRHDFRIRYKQIKSEKIILPSASEALNYINKIGARNPYGFKKIRKQFYKEFCKEFFHTEDKGYPISYKVLTVILEKA
ncbi:methyltransferase domain-containing protein [Desulfurobacterium indicum]|uniref:methyltransferase domain-containing protein n=1 Tax=Desulfurobacterium indicum TaxID=1914305 RepID=UPI000977CE4C|nr:methyltransferase domain-containing protein [Desulfurobacterium indicum]